MCFIVFLVASIFCSICVPTTESFPQNSRNDKQRQKTPTNRLRRSQQFTKFPIDRSTARRSAVHPSRLGLKQQACPSVAPKDMDVTMITQASLDRAWMIGALCRTWSGPLTAVVFTGESSPSIITDTFGTLTEFDRKMNSFKHSCAKIILVGGRKDPDRYPINAMRNIGIRTVKTSHYLYIDIDFWPDSYLYDRVVSPLLTNGVLRDPAAGVVVAAFQQEKEGCTGIDMCRIKHEGHMPDSFQDLKKCVRRGACEQFDKANERGHSTTDYTKWFQQPYDDVRRIECFLSERYEPYVVLRRCPSTPLFNEGFVGYGKNKIQHINHLRYAGFTFYVLPQSFLIHFPHPISASRRQWGKNTGSHNVRVYNDKRFELFMREISGSEKLILTPMCAKEDPH